MTRLLFLLSHTEQGGGEVVVYNLVKSLDRARYEPLVGHVDFRRGDFIQEFTKLGVTPIDFRAGHLRNPVAVAMTAWRIARVIRHQRVDVVVTSGAHNHVYAALARAIVRVPIITYVMNCYRPRLRENPPIVRLALRLGADYYVAASRACLRALEPLIPAEVGRGVVYHGVNEAFFATPPHPGPVREALGLTPGQHLIASVGRLQQWKGHDLFLRAAAQIAQEDPQARFVIVGGSLFGLEPGYGDTLQRLLTTLGLQGRCRLVGHQPNVREWMAAADVIVHAAREPEPGANAVLEAMALGRPVVASSAGAPGEIIESGVNGLLVPPGDHQGLAAAVLRLLREPDVATRLARGAAATIRQSFTASVMTARFTEAIEQVTTSARQTILFTLSSCRRAGHELEVRHVIKALDPQAFRPLAVFLCREVTGTFPDELRQMGVEVIVCRVGRLRNPLNVVCVVSRLIRLIRTQRVSLLFTSGGHNHAYARLAALATGCPTVCHETFLFKAPFWRNGPIYTWDFLVGAEAYFSIGRLTSRTLEAANPWRVPVIYQPCPVDLSVFDARRSGTPCRQQMGIPLDAVVFAIVGRLQAWKGQAVFVRAAREVAREFPNTYFVVAGEAWLDADRPFEADVRQLAADGPGRILLTGFLADPVPVYAAANVICHCSTRPEPLGLVILEAFAMKKPVISVNEGGPLELVRPGVNGWLLPPGDVEALRAAMAECVRHPERLAPMGEAGHQQLLAGHQASAFAKTINRLVGRYARPAGGLGRR